MSTQPGLLLFGAALSASTPALAEDITLTVGPGSYSTISAAVAVANADTTATRYYIINVEPGTYQNDFPEVNRPMTIQVNPVKAGQQAVLKATVPLPNEKGIILTTSNLRVDGLVFTGAAISNSLGGNGAGIRDQNLTVPARLEVENSVFTNNQEGILTGYNASQIITINNSQFLNNGNPDPNFFQHAVYANLAGSLTVSNSLFCGQLIGHNIKSRALMTNVTNSQIYDGEAFPAVGCRTGSSSFAIDVPEGGFAIISGNDLIQGPASPNFKLVAYGEEGLSYRNNSLTVTNNLLVNKGTNPSTGIYDPHCVPVALTGSTFQGISTPVDPASCAEYEQTLRQ